MPGPARFNRPGMDIFTQHVFCLTGDGCLQEGVARESLALAAVLKLDNLILIYDSNVITLDDSRGTYPAYGSARRIRSPGLGCAPD